MTKKFQKYTPLFFCFAAAALFLLFCSKSSPLYPMNDWVDVNCFYTMGKSLLAGKVPYLDLYEQKGPVLYFIYALIALVSPGSYFGVYLLEVVTYGLFLYYGGKILQLYMGETLLAWGLMIIAGGFICVTHAFSHGASVEEMTLFMSAYALYVGLKACKENRALQFREAFLCGIWAGMLLWIKYTMLGAYLGLAVFILLWYPGWGQGKQLLRTIGAFFAGLGAVTAVVFVYFLFAGGLDELWTVYFYNNIFLYAKESDVSKLETVRECLLHTLQLNDKYTWLFIPGFLWMAVYVVKDPRPFLLASLSFICMALGTYWGGWKISYYGLVFSVFTIFGALAIGRLLQLIRLDRFWAKLTRNRFSIGALLLTAVICTTSLCVLKNNRNSYLMGTPKEEMPQYQFAEIINQEEDPSLLNYGFLDGGFYYAADVVPDCYFFCQLNVVAPGMFDIPRDQINEGTVDFVVTRDRPLEDYYNVDTSNYDLVDTAELYFEGKTRTYRLYRLKSLA